MPNPNLINEVALRDWLGFERRADIENKLRELGVVFHHGKGGAIITTLKAVNDAMASNAGNDFDDFEFVKDGQAKSH